MIISGRIAVRPDIEFKDGTDDTYNLSKYKIFCCQAQAYFFIVHYKPACFNFGNYVYI